MGFFERFKKNNEASNSTSFDDLKNVKFAGDVPTEPVEDPEKSVDTIDNSFSSHETKMMAGVMYGINMIAERNVVLSKDDQLRFLDDLEEGKVSQDKINYIISNIVGDRKQQEYAEAFNSLEEKAKGAHLSKLEDKESAEILQNSKVDGDPYLYNGESFDLTTAALEQCGLAPEFKTRVGGREIDLSKVYTARDHDCVMAYVANGEGGFTTRSYYRSRSQGVWRYLPDYTSNGNSIQWFGKGISEEATTLPSSLQKSLNKIPKIDDGKITTLPDFLLAGTAKRYDNKDVYISNLSNGTMRGDFYQEVSAKPIHASYTTLNKVSKAEPEHLNPSISEPDFKKEISEYSYDSSLYGKLTAHEFASQDGNFSY